MDFMGDFSKTINFKLKKKKKKKAYFAPLCVSFLV